MHLFSVGFVSRYSPALIILGQIN